MRPGRRVLALIALLGGCAPLHEERAVPVVSAEKATVAVLPFRTGGRLSPEGAFQGVDDVEAGPGDHGALAARTLADQLAKSGVNVVDPERVFGAVSLADAGRYDPPFAAQPYSHHRVVAQPEVWPGVGVGARDRRSSKVARL